MFLRYFEPVFKPFRALRGRFVKAKSVKGNVKMDVHRAKNMGSLAKNRADHAKGKVGAVQGQAQGATGQVQGAGAQVQGAAPGMPAGAPGMPAGAPGMPGMPQQPPQAINPNPGVKNVGLFRKKRVCTQCNAELDKTWDGCPYCAQAAAAAAPPGSSQKTQAFMIDVAGSGSPMQLLGWVVPVAGPLKGELYTLAPVTLVGTDPTCNIVLVDQYMSSKHAEIKAEGGVWVLKDLGSTNGTYVNDRRIDKQELVDNDFVKFGQCLVKFKSL
jgi:hypothetical protein